MRQVTTNRNAVETSRSKVELKSLGATEEKRRKRWGIDGCSQMYVKEVILKW